MPIKIGSSTSKKMNQKQANIFLLKIDNRNTRTLYDWRSSGVFIINSEQISHN